MSEHIVSGIIKEPAASHCAVGSIHLSGVSPMYVKCECGLEIEMRWAADLLAHKRSVDHERRMRRQPEWMRRARERRLPAKELV